VTDVVVPRELERALLDLIRKGQAKDQASWHWLATWLPSYRVPFVPDMLVALQDMEKRGLVTSRLVGGGMDRWALTPAGAAILDGTASTATGPLSAEELQAFSATVHGGLPATVGAMRAYIGDGLRLWAVLRQLLASNPADAQRVAELGLFLPVTERGPFARELLDDPRPQIREALFRAWTPVRSDVPGKPLPTVPDAELDELLRRGLTDESIAVREAAAALAFLAVGGASLVGELVAALGSPSNGLRWWALLALGGARDLLSLELLSQFAGEADVALASAAIRALGQRSDGHARWFAGLSDPRPDVHTAAMFALATVVTDLDAATLAQLAADPRADVQEALANYRARTGN
jgi:hypothetical protein